MPNISKTLKFLILILTITTLVIIGYFLAFSFLKEKNIEVSNTLNKIDSSLTDDVYLRNLLNTIEEIETRQNTLDSYFVSSDKIIDFLEIIEGLGKNTGADIEVKSIEESEKVDSKSLNNLDLKIIATGNWKSVYHFFILLENLPFKIDINEAQFNKTEIIDGEDIIESWRGSFNFTVVQIKK